MTSLVVGADVSVSVSDVMMPGDTGIELVQRLVDAGQRTPVLLALGLALDTLNDVLSTHSSVAFIANAKDAGCPRPKNEQIAPTRN